MRRLGKYAYSTPAWLGAVLFLVWFSQPPKVAQGQDSQSGRSSSTKKSPSTATSSSATRNGGAAKPKAFSSAEEAAAALYSAARHHDEQAMVLILGPGSKDMIVWTDDPGIRNSDLDQFVQKYDQMHRLVNEPDEETTLYVGPENWPLPIPIVEKNGMWSFDPALGKREILFRRIGENELDAVESLRALVDAENDYYAQTSDANGVREYASKLNSSDGKRDGLYWPQNKNSKGDDADECPLGPYMAQASYDRSDRKPLHGYYFRVLTEQGPKAAGGAHSYMDKGKMTEGFAFVAFPAEYRSSGVQTFIVNQSGRIYEKDLGPMTEQLAKAMKVYNPDATWTRVRKPLGQY